MYQIQQITNSPAQIHTLILQDGSALTINMRFVPMQKRWIITSMDYGSFSLKGLAITTSPNMLHQFRNQIPFGLACFVTGNREPSLQNDFQTEAAILYILSEAEVIEYSELLSG